MKILIAVPTFENIMPDTFKAIYDLDKAGHEVQFEFVRGYDCATARNHIVQMALDKGVDYVLMVDNDVVLPKDALQNLLDDPKDVCLGFYAHRDRDNIYRGRTCVCKLVSDEGIIDAVQLTRQGSKGHLGRAVPASDAGDLRSE